MKVSGIAAFWVLLAGTYISGLPHHERTQTEPRINAELRQEGQPEPKIMTELRQGGQTEPKIMTELRQGGQTEPKAEIGCKSFEKVVVEDEVTISSPGFPEKYPNKKKCKWELEAKDPDAKLEMDCQNFDMNMATRCRKDRLILTDGKGTWQILCGHNHKTFKADSNKITAEFKTDRAKTDKGFQCTVRSVRSSSQSTDTTPFYESTQSSTSKPQPKPPTGSGGTCTCGVANPTRIVGGSDVSPKNKYPWHVALKKNWESGYWCGGAIITDNSVITAAHCFFDKNGNRESDVGLVVGVADHNMWYTSDDVPGATRLVKVAKVILHPNYNPKGYDNDIAILKLSEKLDLSKYKELRPVCLPKDDSNTYAGKTGHAYGWGRIGTGKPQPSVLKEVSLPILPKSRWCWDTGPITDRMLCAGYKTGGKDTCQGDSGGPLTVEESNKHTLVGVVSFGNGCAEPNNPGVYARVSEFLPWIKEMTKDSKYCP